MSEEKSGEKFSEKQSKHERDDQASGLSWAKKLMTVGVGTYFLTEDALKTLVSEFKLPKEIVSGVLDGAKSVRKEFMANFISEMLTRVSEKTDPAAIISEFLKKNDVTLEIKIKVADKKESDLV
jgi:hypothetical protein